MTERAEVVPAALDGERLDRVVALVTGCSRSEAAVLVADGCVRLDGETVTTRSRRVTEGDEVAVVWEGTSGLAPPEPDPTVAVPVVHEDEAVIVVDKPAGLVVHPGAGHRTGTLVHGLLARYPELSGVGGDPDRPGIVHRLDKDTSGLLVVARTEAAHADLVAQLQQRSVERRYRALVWGHLEVAAGLIEGGIGRSRRDRTKMAVSASGRDARTRYEVLATYHDPVDVTLLACRLETGRTHQIRVHLSSIGHAVVGDATYGGARDSFPVPRFVLHAAELSFDHPRTGERRSFASPLPPDLVAVLDRLR
ncbi:MAG: RluA family pseudouridine synthase [Acidimicrobiales bacterium]